MGCSCGADTLVRGGAERVWQAGTELSPPAGEVATPATIAGSDAGRTRVSDPHGSISSPKIARPDSRSCLRRSMGIAIKQASGPASRTTPIPPRPGGVAMATMVSSRFKRLIVVEPAACVGNAINHAGRARRPSLHFRYRLLADIARLVKTWGSQYNQAFADERLVWLGYV